LPGQPPNPYMTAGYEATAFAQREAEMIDGATALVFADGGLGTQWELFEALAKIGTGQMRPKPLIFWGPRALWQPALDVLEAMVLNGTIAPGVVRWVSWTDKVETVLERLPPAATAADCPSLIAR
jgi:predicted Rossmann-fold nucleotide-binding protein